MNAFENLPELQLVDRLKVKNESAAAKAAKQTNPFREDAFSQPAIREFYDLGPGIAGLCQIARTIRIS
jgi:hypothetical protein